MGDIFDTADIIMDNIEFDSAIEELKEKLVERIESKEAKIKSLEEEVKIDREVLKHLLEILSLRDYGVEKVSDHE